MQTKKDIKYRQKKTSNTNARKTLNADKKGHYLKTPCTFTCVWGDMLPAHECECATHKCTHIIAHLAGKHTHTHMLYSGSMGTSPSNVHR